MMNVTLSCFETLPLILDFICSAESASEGTSEGSDDSQNVSVVIIFVPQGILSNYRKVTIRHPPAMANGAYMMN